YFFFIFWLLGGVLSLGDSGFGGDVLPGCYTPGGCFYWCCILVFELFLVAGAGFDPTTFGL
ncbi:hypothetical protein ACVGWD_09935, partial [Enterobacter asburiae]